MAWVPTVGVLPALTSLWMYSRVTTEGFGTGEGEGTGGAGASMRTAIHRGPLGRRKSPGAIGDRTGGMSASIPPIRLPRAGPPGPISERYTFNRAIAPFPNRVAVPIM